MSEINILPEILSNKIAAGEVVQRPASVVKELVENALDAQATRVLIEVGQGGRALIQVSDNGLGMNRDDALLSLERYATSKIHADHDLFNIQTLGFRGEALPSIASVARLTLVTCKRGADIGSRIEVSGGKIQTVRDTGAPQGTMVSVKQLFFNTPARRKFLKTVATEMGHIADIVSRIALGWHRVQFKLVHNRRTVKLLTAVQNPRDRVVDVMGKAFIDRLYPVQLSAGHIHINGWAASPQMTRSTSRGIHLYVNERFVRDRMIQHALYRGYAGRLMKGQFPVVILFIDVPFEMVDVNVHPSKDEVRFADPDAVHKLVTRAVSQAMTDGEPTLWAPSSASPRQAFRTRTALREPFPPYRIPKGKKPEKTHHQDRPKAPDNQQPVRQQETPGQLKIAGKLRIIGQFRDAYILCEAGDALVMIDQHAAHERILYEQLKSQQASQTIPAQRLLTPETVELGYREAAVLAEMIPRLDELGLEIEAFGGNTFIVKAIPALVSDRDIPVLVTELVEKKIETGNGPAMEAVLDAYLALMACHGVIRANQRLSYDEMRALVAQLEGCETPASCPHGRPTWVRWSLGSLEKRFGRK